MPILVDGDPTLNVIFIFIFGIAILILFLAILRSFICWLYKTSEIVKLLTAIAEKMGVDTRSDEVRTTDAEKAICNYYQKNKNEYTEKQFVSKFNNGDFSVSLHDQIGDITAFDLKNWLEDYKED